MPLISSAGIMVAMNISPEVISLIDGIKNDKTHGASQLARQAASVLKVAAERSQTKSTDEFWQEQKEIGQRLMSARPAMAPVFNIVARLLDAMSGKVVEMELDSVRHFAISKVDEVVGDSLRAIAQIAQYGSELIADGDKIMTHSYSSTVVAMLKAAFAEHGNVEVITTRSGPGGSGEMTARELGLYGMTITFIDDTAIGLYLSTVNKVVVGTDRICADGMVVNSVGTYQLALAGKKANIPFYVLCETLKFDPRVSGGEVDLEEKEPSEVIEPGRLPPEVRVKNPHFDITPLELITGIVTENGLLAPGEVISYMQKQSVKDS
ncbi:MAG: S-methyl-5-thioribose-1-phosphate isomerase [Dehalococcoidales bacterium]|nr:S-methyl-5-thioribose-1-phosphate isomerase [Dehalococcoidales bacterium]